MNFDQSYFRSSLITRAPYTTLTKLLQKWATVQPKHEACVFYTFGKPRISITYEKLYQDAVMLANGLLKLGIHKGDIIGIGGNNSLEWLVSTLGTQLAGARPLHFNFHDKSGESLQRIIRVGGCKMLIFDPGDKDVHWEICQKFLQVDSKTGVVDSDKLSVKWVALQTPLESSKVCFTIEDVFSKENIKLPEVDPDDTGAIILTSGSTGFPKAVEYSHHRLIETAYNFLHVVGWDDKKDGHLSLYSDRPFYWLGGYPFIAVAVGGTHITQANTLAFPNIAESMKYTSSIIEKAKPKIAVILVPFLLELLMSKDYSWKIRTVITGGQPVPASCLEAIGKRYDTLSVIYGSTEAAFIAGRMYSSPNDKYIGLSPFPGVELKIVGKDGMMVPIGTKGELLSRTCLPFPGYINEAEKTAAVITPSGWYKTDDFGHINSAGCLEVFGRVSDVMEISGAKVLPSYLEEIIKRNPNVKEVVVFSIKDEIHCDDIPCAAVVKKDGVTLTEESLKDFIKQELNLSEEARFMEHIYVPKYIVFQEKLPKTTTGKSDRKMTKSVSLPFIKQA